ncbi:MAG: pirin family protein [candidate division NC10 bacterium]|nr:pirin family protein [candidate division NC10 bacterium]
MIQVRWGNEWGHTELDWLNSYHSFSFGDYYDPQHMGFRHLRVINEDWVKPGGGFPNHSHRDMEILTYVLEGALEHKDSLGNGSAIRPGEVQRMSAGTGISHSEYNHSQTEPVHLLQIWILPEKRGLEPSYEQRSFIGEERSGTWQLIAARGGRDGAVSVHQDVDVFVARLAPGEQVSHRLKSGRHAWVQVARGAVVLNGTPLRQGDGAAVSAEERLELVADQMSEILLFDLA